MRVDLLSTDHGSIISISVNSRRGRNWVRAHVADGEAIEIDGSVYAEHRYGVDILTGALGDGLTLQDTTTGRIARQ